MVRICFRLGLLSLLVASFIFSAAFFTVRASDTPSSLEHHEVNDMLAYKTTLTASNSESRQFGYSIAASDHTLAVAAPYSQDSTGTPGPGAVYVFERDANGLWSEHTILSSTNVSATNLLYGFGSALALENDTLIVGAPSDSIPGTEIHQAGAVYVFMRDAEGVWRQQVVLRSANPYQFEKFGRSLALSDDTLLVGTVQSANNRSGYVFVRDAQGVWHEQATFSGYDDQPYFYPNTNVALDLDTLVIGQQLGLNNQIPLDPQINPGASARVFVRENNVWSEQALLTPSRGDLKNAFGTSVDVEKDTLVIGAPLEDDPSQAENVGSVYIFERDASNVWIELQFLQPALNTTSYQCFGNSVALDGARLLVGDPCASQTYVFVRNNEGLWVEHQQLASDGSNVAWANAKAVVAKGWPSYNVDIYEPNQPPVAVASARASSVYSYVGFFISGTSSYDPDISSGQTLLFSWHQISGPPVEIENPNSAQIFPLAPRAPATLVFELTVTDALGASATDTVSIEVVPPTGLRWFLPFLRR